MGVHLNISRRRYQTDRRSLAAMDNSLVSTFVLFIVFIMLALVNCDESPWILQQYEVCFEGKENNFGKLRLDQDGALYALKLVYRSGSIRCIPNPTANSRWGCAGTSYGNMVGVVVTDEN